MAWFMEWRGLWERSGLVGGKREEDGWLADKGRWDRKQRG